MAKRNTTILNVKWFPDNWRKLGKVSYKFNSLMGVYEVMFYNKKRTDIKCVKSYNLFEDMKLAIEEYNG